MWDYLLGVKNYTFTHESAYIRGVKVFGKMMR